MWTTTSACDAVVTDYRLRGFSGADAALVVSKNHDLNELCVALHELLSEAPNPTMTSY